MVELEYVNSLSPETVRKVLKKRTQAWAEEVMVHSPGSRRGVGVSDGGRA